MKWPASGGGGVVSPVTTDPIELQGAATFDKTITSNVASGSNAISLTNPGARLSFGNNGYFSGAPGQINAFGVLVLQNDQLYMNGATPPRWGNAALTSATVGAAGAAAAPPASPEEYLLVQGPSGTTRKIPAYAT